MSVQFAVSPIGWINDDLPDVGAGTRLETILDDAAQIGYSGIELGGVFPRRPEVLSPLLAARSLALAGGWWGAQLLSSTPAEEFARAKGHVELLKALGNAVFICAETSNTIHMDRGAALSSTPRIEAAEMKAFAGRIDEFAGQVASEGLGFAWHQHLGTVVEGPKSLEVLLAETGPDVGLTVDTAHLTLAGIDPAALVRAHPDRVRHVHCKDVRRSVARSCFEKGGSFLDGVLAGAFTAPGDGDLDLAGLMSALAEIGYAGWIVAEAEQDPRKADPRIYAAIGLSNLRRWAGEAGLEVAERPA
ncbi:MAG: myo-inosose-2 dehydratase [Caulobacteraceae bacterium]